MLTLHVAVKSMVLNRGGVKKFLEGVSPYMLYNQEKFLNGNVSLSNVASVLILRRYTLFGLVPAEMEVGLSILKF